MSESLTDEQVAQYEALRAAIKASPGGYDALAPEMREWIAEYSMPFHYAMLRFSDTVPTKP